MMHLPMRFPHHVLDHGMIFLAHRRKILMQAYNDFKEAYPNLWVGLEMGEREATGMEDVIFASVESLGREYQMRITKYQDRKFGAMPPTSMQRRPRTSGGGSTSPLKTRTERSTRWQIGSC